ncbi:putative phosphatidate phosphatase isoform X2 [Anthonomus grandis grandis]|uniref:putative phosphatidate phosphatase isoform X2 n=1 Tax=Anthonomus grandis grandis TaxID=2921223 RepID=UPI002166075F|nr:putative phosphatidate phosphatase isoform X2 [Anthonomus grandis grandis]XP_050295171.1 putative phosphatidate phosphatase isoform X2 [Anthonomus grandis grandis]
MADDSVVVPLRKVVFDVLLLQLVGWPILFLFLWGNPFHRGFFCEDDSLRHPYHESTVPSWTLYITGFGLNVITMMLTEILNRPNEKKTFYFMGKNIPYWMFNAYCAIGMFAFGAACSQLTTDVMKYTIGRLRPHFYTVCKPSINCSLPENQFVYHTDFTCTNPLYSSSKRIMKEMRLSFPSGHSSFSMYTMVYFAIYLQKRMTWDGSKLLRHTLQFLAVLSAVFTAMTRVSDYKHHWSDVLIGLLLGATIAIITANYFARFQPENGKIRDTYIAI